MRARNAIAAGLLMLAVLPSAWAANVAGEVTMVTGRGTAVAPDGNVRNLNRGDRVYAGDIVNSGVNSYLNLKFTDGGLVLLRPNTRFQIEEYVYGGKAGPAPAKKAAKEAAADSGASKVASASAGSRSFFKLMKGGFRAVSGLIGKADANQYRVSTPTATIGIRGTDYWVVTCGTDCYAIKEGDIPPGSTVVGVVKDGVFIKNADGDEMELGEDEYMNVLPDGSMTKLPFEPRFIRVDPFPNPETCLK